MVRCSSTAMAGATVDRVGPGHLGACLRSVQRGYGGRYPVRSVPMCCGLSSRVARVRMTGSTGVDLSFTAAGIFGGAVIFGRHAWDNAPGTALVRAAGGVATDLAGAPWTVNSPSLVVGAPGLHSERGRHHRGLARRVERVVTCQ